MRIEINLELDGQVSLEHAREYIVNAASDMGRVTQVVCHEDHGEDNASGND